MSEVLQDLGLDISSKKLTPPSTKVVCLGILFDTEAKTISIPQDKLQIIMDTCSSWTGRTSCSKTELQSLLGSILYISKCVRPARHFLNRMLQLLRNNIHSRHIFVTEEFRKDLNWFCVFLKSYNGVTMYDLTPVHKRVYLDASLTGFDSFVYTLRLPLAYQTYNIAYLEMLNVVVAFKVWAYLWANHRIQIHCDNMAVVEVLQQGYARDMGLATCARNIWFLMAKFNISADFVHIPGHENHAADLLSGWNSTPQDYEKLLTLVPKPLWLTVHPDLLLNHNI